MKEYSNDKIMRKIDEIRSIQGHLNQAISGLKLLLLFVEHHEEREVQKMIDRLMADKELLKRLKYSENTEVVSSAESESSVYTDVRESHASGDTEQPQALVEGALFSLTLRAYGVSLEVRKGGDPFGLGFRYTLGWQ